MLRAADCAAYTTAARLRQFRPLRRLAFAFAGIDVSGDATRCTRSSDPSRGRRFRGDRQLRTHQPAGRRPGGGTEAGMGAVFTVK
jgi:hypothetical protein